MPRKKKTTEKATKESRNKGSVTEIVAGKKYKVRISLPRDPKKPASSRQPTKSWVFKGSSEEAHRFKRRMITEYCDEHAEVGASSMTVSKMLDEYYDSKRDTAAPTSLEAYRYQMVHLNDKFGSVRADQLKKTVVRRVFNDWWKEEAYSWSYLNSMKVFLSGAYKYQINDKSVPMKNPVTGLKIGGETDKAPKTERTTIVDGVDISNGNKKALTEDQVVQFIEATRGTANHTIWMLMLKTGIRIGEACALRWIDVKIDEDDRHYKSMFVTATQHEVEIENGDGTMSRKKYNNPDTKGKVDRTITMTDEVIDMLRKHRTLEEQRRRWHFKGEKAKQWRNYPSGIDKEVTKHDELVFHNQRGAPISKSCSMHMLRYWLRKLEAQAQAEADEKGIERDTVSWDLSATTHALRHTYGSIAVSRGCSLSELQQRLGHKKLETTLLHYIHDMPDTEVSINDIWNTIAPLSAEGGAK